MNAIDCLDIIVPSMLSNLACIINILLLLDVNECSTGVHNCHRNADCTDTPGAFRCRCSAGYNGDGIQSCTGIAIFKP